jgi:hypothetical protein
MQIFLTILAGAGTFVLGQIFMKLLIDPVQVLKVTIAEIADKLIYFANVYANPKPAGDEKQTIMSSELRILSSKLQSGMYLIPAYKITAWIFGLPTKESIVRASEHLIFIHNGYDGGQVSQGVLNCYAAQNACLALNIYISESNYLKPENEAVFMKARNK